MSATVRVQVLGGFLGSGKTTAVIALARHFTRQGYHVAAITNDHGDIGFDAQTIRAESIDAREISEGCLCCRFQDFLYAADNLLENVKPDIVLAEPVGTCLYLPRGLLLPLSRYARERYTVGPLSVLVDPHRFRSMISGHDFDPSVRYLFEQQLGEADILVINKSDTLSPSDCEQLMKDISARYPKASVHVISALRGDGIEEWATNLLETAWEESKGDDSRADYEEYRRAESTLGYLDAIVKWESSNDLDTVALARGTIALLQHRLNGLGVPVAHMKMAVVSAKNSFRVHWIAHEDPEWIDLPPGPVTENSMIVTIRAQGDPEQIEGLFKSTVRDVSNVQHVEPLFESVTAFRPWPPTVQ
ncbi:MAG: GTP-binding protein [bacterium]